MVLNRIYTSLRYCKQVCRIHLKAKIEGDENVLTSLNKEVYKPKHHPGIIKPKTVSLPLHIVQAIEDITQDYPQMRLTTDSIVLSRHLKGRALPVETDKLNKIREKTIEHVLLKENHIDITTEVEDLQFKEKIKNKVENLLKENIYNWSPINYNVYNSLLYLFARSAPEFAVLAKIFSEINARDPNYKPKTLFDFGSGVGTVTWAAQLYWKTNIFENLNIDISPEINNLAQTILQKSSKSNTVNLKGVFYRQFLPAKNTTYDLVVSAYTMFELPSFQTRMEIALNLWNKTNKYLVVVEQGTRAGFKIVNEIRDLILKLRDNEHVAHVFSPCPHDKQCPRYLFDNTPCNFEVGYTKPFGRDSTVEKERYSYVILKKENRNTAEEWPRVVRETLVRSKHTICRICTSKGTLEEVIVTASKNGKLMYHCARATKWGDRLPINLIKNNEDQKRQ